MRYDLIVAGGGSGGVRAARRAAAAGARVLLAESAALGGTCVNVGCVPKKLFYYAAGLRETTEHAAAYGYPSAALGDFAWHTLRDNKSAEIKRLNAVYQSLLQESGVDIVSGHAALQDGNTVDINGSTYQAQHILLATGGEPVRPPLPGAEHAALSDDLFYLSEFPRRVIMVGGGYIALEFAGIFNGLGARTTLCYRADLPMRGLDSDMRQRLADGIAASGVSIAAGSAPERITAASDGLQLHLQGGKTLEADLVVFATGRRPRTAALNLDSAGIAPAADGTLAVDADYRTACASVYAIGDLIPTPALTPVATAEAEVFVRRVFGGEREAAVDYQAVPTAVFSRPGLATTGIGEAAAAARGLDITVQRAAFKPMQSSFAGGSGESYIKLVSERGSGRVIGAQMLGADAAEIMQGIAVAIKAGATAADFGGTVGIHPTSAEEFVTLR